VRPAQRLAAPLYTLLACLATLSLAGLPAIATAQSDEQQARARLRALEQDIERIGGQISAASTRRDSLQRQLRDTEVRLGALQREIGSIGEDIRRGEAELTGLQARRAELLQARAAQEERVAWELRAAWESGGQGHIRLLLDQQHPDTVARLMAYYRYLLRSRSEVLAGYRATLAELDEIGVRIDRTLAALGARRTELHNRRERLAAGQTARADTLQALKADIARDSRQLREKEADRAQLEELLRAIEEAVVRLTVPEDYQPFASARGAMAWPVAGEPSHRFGHPRNAGKMRWQGVTIPAQEGTTVRAIHHGRVVYADWLRGSGLLLILDHGGGYMSLYAHNQSLLRDVGEWVKAGDAVSTVGNSGGRDDHALYFEIRHQGKPVDPSAWCRG